MGQCERMRGPEPLTRRGTATTCPAVCSTLLTAAMPMNPNTTNLGGGAEADTNPIPMAMANKNPPTPGNLLHPGQIPAHKLFAAKPTQRDSSGSNQYARLTGDPMNPQNEMSKKPPPAGPGAHLPKHPQGPVIMPAMDTHNAGDPIHSKSPGMGQLNH